MKHSLWLFPVLLLLSSQSADAALWGGDYIENDSFGYCQDKRLSPDDRIADCVKAAKSGLQDTDLELRAIDGIAWAYQDKPDYRDAALVFTKAISLADRTAAPLQLYYRGIAYVRAGQQDLAQADFKSAEQAGGKLYSDAGLAELAASDGEFDKAIALYTKAIALNGLARGILALRADIYARSGDYDHAIADEDAFVEGEKFESYAYASRCWARAVLNRDLDAAAADCTHALDLHPEDPDTLDDFGLVFYRQQNWDEAVSKYSEALKHNPYLASSLYMRGICELRKGKTAQGEDDIKQALTIYPQIRLQYVTYGITP